jgi:hypothetical protein
VQPPERKPEDCKNGDLIHKELVADWPALSDKSAIAFRRWTGVKLHAASRLVRKGKHIFQITEAEMARCVYCHDRQF